ncbi:hypothetical protein [Shewanella psychrotolerans]|uniref:hypothetical protein n=1 Tax=Shewanella psychrotolerans TaxID=2864206 RepID=UPI001C65B34F|nr:hypothetical protein [Shewanella psychrotolerans]QYK00619.1 hypothetical protein K0I62_14635 [Shewanella psychrotolerans]
MFKRLFGLLAIGLLGGCAANEPELYSRINEAYDFEVTHCDSFAIVTGVGRGDEGVKEAKISAKRQGEALLGTHIVWLHIDNIEDSDQTRVVAIVYKCLV